MADKMKVNAFFGLLQSFQFSHNKQQSHPHWVKQTSDIPMHPLPKERAARRRSDPSIKDRILKHYQTSLLLLSSGGHKYLALNANIFNAHAATSGEPSRKGGAAPHPPRPKVEEEAPPPKFLHKLERTGEREGEMPLQTPMT